MFFFTPNSKMEIEFGCMLYNNKIIFSLLSQHSPLYNPSIPLLVAPPLKLIDTSTT